MKLRMIAEGVVLAFSISVGVAALADESFFQVEVGLGNQHSSDMGDGIWKQEAPSTPYQERISGPGVMGGVTGEIVHRGRYGLRYHADYIYMGQMSLNAIATDDANYNPQTHSVVGKPTYARFYGMGHTQGLALTLEPEVTFGDVTLGVEGGMWANWATWHETAYELYGIVNANHRTKVQLAPVWGVDATVSNFTLSYRYLGVRQAWNPYPGLITGTHMIMATWRF